jgi:hypothetical protein
LCSKPVTWIGRRGDDSCLAGEELAAHTRLLSAAPPTAAIPASATVATIIDVAVPQGTLPAVLTHRIAYDLPADLNPALRALSAAWRLALRCWASTVAPRP